MFSVPFEFKCSACGRRPTAAGRSLCVLCGGFFCSDHLIVKKGVATCESCAVEREQREESGGVSGEDEARVVSLLRRTSRPPSALDMMKRSSKRLRAVDCMPMFLRSMSVTSLMTSSSTSMTRLSTPRGPRVRIIRTTRCGSRTGGGAANGPKKPSPDSARSLA